MNIEKNDGPFQGMYSAIEIGLLEGIIYLLPHFSGDRKLSIANWFIRIGLRDGKLPTLLQLVKNSIYCSRMVLGNREKPLILDHVEAWKYGPVIPSIYHACKHWKDKVIRDIITNTSWEREDYSSYEPVPKSDTDTSLFLESVVQL